MDSSKARSDIRESAKKKTLDANSRSSQKSALFCRTNNTDLSPPKPKSSLRHLKQGIKSFFGVPADNVAKNVVNVYCLQYINTLKKGLNCTKT